MDPVSHYFITFVFVINAEGKNIFQYENMRTKRNMLHYFYNVMGMSECLEIHSFGSGLSVQ